MHIFHKETKVASQCLKITEKVSFNNASEASAVYILSGQKFIKNTKNGQFRKPEAYGHIVLLDRTFLIGQKLVEKKPKLKIANATL